MWYVWTIVTKRMKDVCVYLDGLSFVGAYLYPTIDKKTERKGKEPLTRKVPVYGNYIFIKYDRTEDKDCVLNRCKWLVGYVGLCTDKEMKMVRKVVNYDYGDLFKDDYISVGSHVKFITTVFSGFSAIVMNMDGDVVTVSIRLFGADNLIKCNMDDIVLL